MPNTFYRISALCRKYGKFRSSQHTGIYSTVGICNFTSIVANTTQALDESLATGPSITPNLMTSYKTSWPVATVSETQWFSAKILHSYQNGEGLHIVEVEVPNSITSSYTQPGQYVQLKCGNSLPNYFVIASPPDNRSIMSFLIKHTPRSQELLSLPLSSNIEVSLPLGNGFELNTSFKLSIETSLTSPVDNVLLFACGTGLASIASVIDSGRLHSDFLCDTNDNVEPELTSVADSSENSENNNNNNMLSNKDSIIINRQITLYIGVRTPAHLPLRYRYNEWKTKGIKIVPVVSRPLDPLSVGWEGHRGYVQDVLRREGVDGPCGTAALLCGMRGMTDSVREILLKSGFLVMNGKGIEQKTEPMEFYRSSAVGIALTKSLQTMIDSEEISKETAFRILNNFDDTFQSALRDNLLIRKGFTTIHAEGDIASYNNYLDLWKIDAEDVTVTMEENSNTTTKYKRARFLFTK